MTKPIVTRSVEEVFNLWIAALESGKYKRATGVLRDSNRDAAGKLRHSFCCLGVLCDLARQDGGPQWQFEELNWSGPRTTFESAFLDEGELLPPAFATALYIDADHQDTLAAMNDETTSYAHDAQYKFSQKDIAEYIRRHVKPAALNREREAILRRRNNRG